MNVKRYFSLNPFFVALIISVAVHAVLLMLRFDFLNVPTKVKDSGLEIVLAQHAHALPKEAKMLAQSNQMGDVTAEEQRSRHQENAHQKNEGVTKWKLPPVPNMIKSSNISSRDAAKELSKISEQVSRNFKALNDQVHRTQITPSTREVGYAMYYKALQERIERTGTFNFPTRNGQKLYGELIVSIPVFQDGTIYEKEGGPRVEKSSGNPDLDKITLTLIRRSAPFGRFPDNMRSATKDDVWEIIARFKFTREEIAYPSFSISD